MFATKRVAFLKKTTVILKPCCIKSSFRYAQEDPYMEFAFVFHRKHAIIMIMTKVVWLVSFKPMVASLSSYYNLP